MKTDGEFRIPVKQPTFEPTMIISAPDADSFGEIVFDESAEIGKRFNLQASLDWCRGENEALIADCDETIQRIEAIQNSPINKLIQRFAAGDFNVSINDLK